MQTDVSVQKGSFRWDMPRAVRAVAVDGDGVVWAGTPSGLMRLADGAWKEVPGLTDVRALAVDGGRLWAGTARGLFRREGGTWVREEPDAPILQGVELPVHAVAVAGDRVAIAGPDIIAFRHEAGWEALPGFRAHALCYDAEGVLWCGTDDGLQRYDGLDWQVWASADPPPFGNHYYAVARDAAGHVWLGTARGVELFDGEKGWHEIAGKDGLPYEGICCLSLGADGSRWFGTPCGAIRLKDGVWEHFAGKRWLPDDRVNAVWALPDGGAWIATDGGLARVEYRPMTLAEKAAAFEERIVARHDRMGYVSSCRLETPGDLEHFVYEASDNDGLWTALYVAAESFRHAVTRDPEARARARRSLEALMRLEAVTPIDGFPARAVVRKGERVDRSGGEWHETPDGDWLWKGDTSSDEIDGHLFAYGIYFDLVADAGEKQEIAAVVGRIMGHIVDHGFMLVDLDGEHTRWGVWSPRLLNDDPDWEAERGLNSLEILAHLRSAHHITGEARFEEAYRTLVEKEHYALNAIRQKLTREDGHVNHSDDELAFISYYPLLRYEEDPEPRALHLLSLERSWQIERPERCPLWNLIYGALTGRPCDVDESIDTLQRIPIDLVAWDMRNSHRADVAVDPESDRFGEEQSVVVLPPDERAVMKWNGNPYRLDGGHGGLSEDDGTFFLLPYWLGRYHGLVEG